MNKIPVKLVITLKVDANTEVEAAKMVGDWLSETKVADSITMVSIEVPHDRVVLIP